MLEIQDLCYTVSDGNGRKEILDHLSLTIPDKRFVVITGPNGGGKTTLARAIMGINQTNSGSIIWNGTDITNLSVSDGPSWASATDSSSPLDLRDCGCGIC